MLWSSFLATQWGVSSQTHPSVLVFILDCIVKNEKHLKSLIIFCLIFRIIYCIFGSHDLSGKNMLCGYLRTLIRSNQRPKGLMWLWFIIHILHSREHCCFFMYSTPVGTLICSTCMISHPMFLKQDLYISCWLPIIQYCVLEHSSNYVYFNYLNSPYVN